MRDYIRQRGTAAFGTRLRRLSERVDREVQAIYRERALAFEPRWFPIVSALHAHRTLSVGDLAELIGVTHAAVSPLRAELIAAGLVRTRPDRADQRRLLVELTPGGRRMVARLLPLWTAIADGTALLCAEAAPDLLDELDRIEAALGERSLKDRVALALDAEARNAPPAQGGRHARARNP
ncbi:MAG: MarR family winged helix-turn-helix transcriptional regulator [Burkholderiales bacterium]